METSPSKVATMQDVCLKSGESRVIERQGGEQLTVYMGVGAGVILNPDNPDFYEILSSHWVGGDKAELKQGDRFILKPSGNDQPKVVFRVYREPMTKNSQNN